MDRTKARRDKIGKRVGMAATLAATAAITIAGAAAGCGDNTTGPEARVVSVEVSSPIDSIMATGGSTQLTATGKDDRGTTVQGVAFRWSSTAQNVSTVSGTGVVHAVAPGTTTITAATQGATGTLAMRVVAADFPAVTALLTDPYAAALVARLGETPRDRVGAALADCDTALETGHVIAVRDCLKTIANEAAADDVTDRVLAIVLAVYSRRAEQLLNL